MFQVVLTIKQESGDVPTETRELQVANFVGPTLVDLGLYSWMEKHGGMVSTFLRDDQVFSPLNYNAHIHFLIISKFGGGGISGNIIGLLIKKQSRGFPPI